MLFAISTPHSKSPVPTIVWHQLVAMGWGSGVTFSPLPWVLVPGVWHSVASLTSAHWYPLRGLFSSDCDCRLWPLQQHTPWSFYRSEDVLWHLELEMLLMNGEFSSRKRENILPRGRSLVSWPQVFLDWTLLPSKVSLERWALIKLRFVGQWGIMVNLKSWRLMEICRHGAYNF